MPLLQSNSCPLCRSICDPARSTPDDTSPGASDAAPEQTAGGATAPEGQQTPAQMMQMLQDLLAGGDFPAGFGEPSAREESREEYSSMYS